MEERRYRLFRNLRGWFTSLASQSVPTVRDSGADSGQESSTVDARAYCNDTRSDLCHSDEGEISYILIVRLQYA